MPTSEVDNLLDILDLTNEDLRKAVTPDWEHFVQDEIHVHDWRKYVPEGMRPGWETLPMAAVITTYYFCEQRADMEEWD